MQSSTSEEDSRSRGNCRFQKIPVFAAAEHITTLDELRWLYVPELSGAAKEAFDRIQAALPQISDEANAERINRLPSLGVELQESEG